MITVPAGSDFDRADQDILADDNDRDIGLDATALHPLTERVRAAVESAEIADRIDQSWITPHDDDDYACLAY